MHTLLDLRGNIPAFIHMSDRKLADVNVLDILQIEVGAFYIMDRGYVDYSRLFNMYQLGAFFVTRAKQGMNIHRVYSSPVDRSTGIICDQMVAHDGHYASQNYPENLRRVRFKDPYTGKTWVFLTNNTKLLLFTIALLYKARWQINLFFKWIKQYLKIKRFMGTSENVLKIQIWSVILIYILIAIVKKELHLEASLYTLLQILSVLVFEKTPISSALRPVPNHGDEVETAKQLIYSTFNRALVI